MVVKKPKKQNAKTRYDAKKPTVSARVSLEEFETLDELRKKNGITFREMLLKGAGIIKKEKKDKKKVEVEINNRVKERIDDAEYDARCIQLGECNICGKPMIWDLNDANIQDILSDAINAYGPVHIRCKR